MCLRKNIYLSLLLAAMAFLVSCSGKKSPDVSHITVKAAVIQVDRLLNECQDTACLRSLMQKYPAFSNVYFQHILQLTHPDRPDSVLSALQEWRQDSVLSTIQAEVTRQYGDLGDVQDELDDLYAHFLFYFPKKEQLPVIYTCQTGMAVQSFLFQEQDGKTDGIGIGLDMMLHPEIPYKKLNPDNTAFSDYLTRSWNKQHLVRKVAETILTDIVGSPGGSRLIDEMIHEGKKMYMLQLLMPEAPDTVLTEFSTSQLEWCHANALQMWSFFFDEKLFFETSPVKIAKYVYPAPTSAGMPKESPGRTGVYLGWQIVNAYMDRYPETSLEELLKISDGQAVLEKSKYKPKQ